MPRPWGCALPLADDFIRERVLARVAMDALIARGRPRKAVPEAAGHARMDRLRAAAAPVEHAEPGMVPIAKAAEKARVRAIDIVHLILGGFLRRVQRLRALDGISGLLVDPAEVREAAARTLVGISAAEAFGILKMPPASVWALVDEPEEETAIPAISIEGENASYRFHRFRREDLEAFNAVFTTVPRIAEQTWHEFKLDEIGRRLNIAGVKPVFRKRDLGIQLYRIADLPAAFRAPSSSPPARNAVKELPTGTGRRRSCAHVFPDVHGPRRHRSRVGARAAARAIPRPDAEPRCGAESRA